MKPQTAALIIVLTAANLSAGNFSSGAIGTTGAGFLNLGMGARAIAMGGAYSAVADDASAAYWNPAGLVRSEGASFMFMHASYLSGISFDYLSFAASKGSSAFGGSIGYMNAGSIAQTDNNGAALGSYQPRDYYGTVSYAADLDAIGAETGRYSAGLSAKYLSSTIIEKAGAVAFDAGLTGRFEIAGAPLKVGFVAQNFGPGMKYKNVTDPLPTTYKLGAAAGVSGKWLLSAELAAPRGNSPYLCAGAEHTAYSSDNLTVALRTGLSSLTLSGLSGLNGLSAGMGLGFSRVSVDYSVVLFGELGMAHRLSMTLKLGADKAPSRQAARGETRNLRNASASAAPIYFIH
ncbi:MAG: hypothetical protein A3J79_13345 [Elusimicrobia bacterium RIFOXYB2_FULL_62_6]|nr:MAG: hypothetical protein A3J79_13345 [Elusimicrobia bacterium RIFOXYB2_FULL_62_6]